MSKNNIAVSVVLPSLNVKKYINECVSSVRAQTLKNIEIICVDAGSTDGTWEELQEIANCDTRIALVHSDKKSYGYQVNLGMAMARGEYVAIVDTDDMIRSDMYEKLYEIAIREDADFVKADYEEFEDVEGAVKVKKYVNIIQHRSLYNRILDIEQHQECFHPQITATWGGIYKKGFLEGYNIKHNETPGASYQDMGFWFQTYAFAKRAYFINESGYMYRVDNPNSSVVNPNKVYCICDEFEFVKTQLKAFAKMECYKDIFTWILYRKYFRNLERIAPERREEFFEKFAKDFNKLKVNKEIGYALFDEEEQLKLNSIMNAPIDYYHSVLEMKKQLLKELEVCEQLIVYGAGIKAQEVVKAMKRREHILAYAVSVEIKEEKRINNILVKRINELTDYRDASVAVLIKDKRSRLDMVKNAKRLGFVKVIVPRGDVFEF